MMCRRWCLDLLCLVLNAVDASIITVSALTAGSIAWNIIIYHRCNAFYLLVVVVNIYSCIISRKLKRSECNIITVCWDTGCFNISFLSLLNKKLYSSLLTTFTWKCKSLSKCLKITLFSIKVMTSFPYVNILYEYYANRFFYVRIKSILSIAKEWSSYWKSS